MERAGDARDNALRSPNKQLTGKLLPPVTGLVVTAVTSLGDGAPSRDGAGAGIQDAPKGRKTVDAGSAWPEAVQSACSSRRSWSSALRAAVAVTRPAGVVLGSAVRYVSVVITTV